MERRYLYKLIASDSQHLLRKKESYIKYSIVRIIAYLKYLFNIH